MRAIQTLAVAALVVVDVSTSGAQATRHFKDSWFWGLKGGAISYQVQSQPSSTIAPMGGADWFITRTQGGLYVSFDHSFFNEFVFVNDSVSPVDVTPGGRRVDLRNMRRVTLAGMLFPMQTYHVHPYIGFGAALNSIARATPTGTYVNNTQQNLVLNTIRQFQTGTSPVIMLGTQLRIPLASAFVQLTASPTTDTFFLFTGGGWRTTLEAGMRYNVGTSIDRMP